jgi:predicted RNA-binding protein YlqC (UPF0109 family)
VCSPTDLQRKPEKLLATGGQIWAQFCVCDSFVIIVITSEHVNKEVEPVSSIDEQFVEFVIKSLVTKPDAVKIERRIDEKGVLLELTVDPEDLGRVIGKRGATAQSVRTLLRALGTKNDARYNLKIVDNGPERSNSGSGGGGAWGSDDNDTPSDKREKPESPVSAENQSPQPQPEEKPNDSLAKTRKELDDLDDLDI